MRTSAYTQRAKSYQEWGEITMKIRCVLVAFLGFLLSGCSPERELDTGTPQPTEIIDLGALVTHDLTLRVWGKRMPRERGYDRPNVFEVLRWPPGPINGQNSYYTLFNHGGPHVDAPVHMGFEGGMDSYDIESFAGPLKVFDVSHLPMGRTVDRHVFERESIEVGDVVMIYTNYRPPVADDEYQQYIALTHEAADYLANIPIRAFATDAFSVDALSDDPPTEPTTDLTELIPVHNAFLPRGIPVFEQLFTVNTLLGKENLFFVGQPLNIKDGDGMLVRPLVFVY
jgi:kynurenine formamidase